jgi:hypothetical protein
MIGDRFKDYSGILLVPFELSMPCRWTILPTPMHTINGAKHTWKSPVGVELQKSCRVLSMGALKYVDPKTFTIATAKRFSHKIEVLSPMAK